MMRSLSQLVCERGKYLMPVAHFDGAWFCPALFAHSGVGQVPTARVHSLAFLFL